MDKYIEFAHDLEENKLLSHDEKDTMKAEKIIRILREE